MSERNSKLLARFQAYLEQEEKSDAQDQAQETRIAQTVFWSEMRNILAVNVGSSGLDILDDVAKSLIDDTGLAAQALSGPVTILPHPSRQSISTGATPHPSFTGPAKKRPASAKPAKSSTSKKQKATTSPASSPAALRTPLINFPLAPGLPKEFVRDLESIFRHVAAVKLKPWQRAYPWVNQHLFYDPVEYPDIYLAHWRFWHAFREVFFEWALHAPLWTDSDEVQRRKRKMAAVRERLIFISLSIEPWGYYNFLRRIEAPGNSTLMWWGGQAGNTTKEAKSYTGSPIYDLYRLYQKDKSAYQRKIRDAIKPFQIGKGRFTTITELLEKTEALDPSLVELDKRLTERALARIVKDLTSAYYVPDHWAPSNEVWKTLCNDKRTSALQVNVTVEMRDGAYELPTVLAYDPKEFKRDYSPLMGPDGKQTALGPVTQVDDSNGMYRPDPDDLVAKELAAEEAKADAAASQQEVVEEEESQEEGEVEEI